LEFFQSRQINDNDIVYKFPVKSNLPLPLFDIKNKTIEANLGISMISMISVRTIIDYENVTLFEQIVLSVNYYGNCDTRQKHLSSCE
jgi:hypothetical protein